MNDQMPVLVLTDDLSTSRYDLVHGRTQTGLFWSVDLVDTPGDAMACADDACRSGVPYVVAFLEEGSRQPHEIVRLMVQLCNMDADTHVIVVGEKLAENWHPLIEDFPHAHRMVVLPAPIEPVTALQFARWVAATWYETTVQRATAELPAADVNPFAVKEATSRSRHAGQLQAIGQLAAGIAHELGTPIQYASDSSYFLQTAWTDIEKLVTNYRELAADDEPTRAERQESIQRMDEQFEAKFFMEEVPHALERLEEGLSRVSSIISAMRELAPRSGEMNFEQSDINRTIANTLTIARGTFRNRVPVHARLGKIPCVACSVSDVSNAILNLLVNAVHAVEDRHGSKSVDDGRVEVITSTKNGWVYIRVNDNGLGISEEAANRIFDPFFTTKEVGRGTGQGLPITRAIVEAHGGEISFKSEPGIGTAFTLALPVDGPPQFAHSEAS